MDNFEKADNWIINMMSQQTEYNFEELHFLYEKELGAISKEELQVRLDNVAEKIRIQKSINTKNSQKNTQQIIMELNLISDKLKAQLHKIEQYEDMPGKINLDLLREIRQNLIQINDINQQLKKQQEAQINNYYIPITQLQDWLDERMLQAEPVIEVIEEKQN